MPRLKAEPWPIYGTVVIGASRSSPPRPCVNQQRVTALCMKGHYLARDLGREGARGGLTESACDTDADGFPNCGKHGCCTSEEKKTFEDCNDGDADAYPYDSEACENCPNGCVGTVADVEVVNPENGDSENADVASEVIEVEELPEVQATDLPGEEIEVCIPDCAGKVCGSDGCGGVCACAGGEACRGGICCACASGVCCDGCDYRSSNDKCAEDVNTEYTCKDGTACGADVYVHHQDRYCSGSSASCDGVLKWDEEIVADNCAATETCSPGDATCNLNQEECRFVDNGNGTVTDTKTNLVWQRIPNADSYKMCSDPEQAYYGYGSMPYELCGVQYRDAENHCGNNEDGLPGADWRLPTISALRSLIRDCDATYWDPLLDTGGDCGVTDDCLTNSCGFGEPCNGCSGGEGPGEGGQYIDSIFSSMGHDRFWSSSICADDTMSAWLVNFGSGAVRDVDVSAARGVRCVRGGP
jgi:Protein of unknown function (DUF1566)